jgi:hypothetical protein
MGYCADGLIGATFSTFDLQTLHAESLSNDYTIYEQGLTIYDFRRRKQIQILENAGAACCVTKIKAQRAAHQSNRDVSVPRLYNKYYKPK